MTRRSGIILLVAAAVVVVSSSPAVAGRNTQRTDCRSGLNALDLDISLGQPDVLGATGILKPGVVACDGHGHGIRVEVDQPKPHPHHAHSKPHPHHAHPKPHAHHHPPLHQLPPSVSNRGGPTSHDVPSSPKVTANTNNPAPTPPDAVGTFRRPMVGVPLGSDTLREATSALGLDKNLLVLAGLVLVPLLLYSLRRALSE